MFSSIKMVVDKFQFVSG